MAIRLIQAPKSLEEGDLAEALASKNGCGPRGDLTICGSLLAITAVGYPWQKTPFIFSHQDNKLGVVLLQIRGSIMPMCAFSKKQCHYMG